MTLYDAIPPFNKMYLAAFDAKGNEVSPKRELVNFKVRFDKDGISALKAQNSALVKSESKIKEVRFFDKPKGGKYLFTMKISEKATKLRFAKGSIIDDDQHPD